MDPTLLTILIIVIVLVITLIVIAAIRRVIQRRQLMENAAHQHFVPPNIVEPPLFIPKGRVTYNKPTNQQQMQVQKPLGSSPARGFQGRGQDKTLKGTCFLTGKSRSSCDCDECKKKRRSI